MTISTPSRPRHTTRSLLLVTLSLLFVAASGTVAVSAADYDPSRPKSSTGNGGSQPPDGGGGDPPPPGRAPIALGMSMPDSRNLAQLDSFTASIDGHQPPIWSLWSLWGMDSTKDFPTSAVSGLRDRGVTPFVFWEPWDRTNRTDPQYRFANISRGDHDPPATLRRNARRINEVLLNDLLQIVKESFPVAANYIRATTGEAVLAGFAGI
jgi:hypothetical protein